MEKSVLFDHIRDSYGFIKRCRGPYLYTSKEVRLVDLYQEGGRAVLGWRAGKSMLVVKNALEKGLWGEYCDPSKRRLEQALKTLFSFCGLQSFTHFSWYCTDEILHTDISTSPIPVLYPWSGLSPSGIPPDSEAVFFIPPFPFPSLVIGASSSTYSLPVSSPLSSCIMEALSRALYDLIDAFKERTEGGWALYDDILSPYFTRKGSALYPKLSGSEYDEFVLHCLNCGLVLNPSSEYPSFVPHGVHKSLIKKIDLVK